MGDRRGPLDDDVGVPLLGAHDHDDERTRGSADLHDSFLLANSASRVHWSGNGGSPHQHEELRDVSTRSAGASIKRATSKSHFGRDLGRPRYVGGEMGCADITAQHVVVGLYAYQQHYPINYHILPQAQAHMACH